jgi:2-phospho-L-lactate guanylyltransferase (CobY/MobA/RfbA family)
MTQEEAKKYLSGNGYGYGTNYTTELVAALMADVSKQAAIDALAKAERMAEVEQKEPNPFAVQSLDRYDIDDLQDLLEVVLINTGAKTPTKLKSMDLWAYRIKDAIKNKQKDDIS